MPVLHQMHISGNCYKGSVKRYHIHRVCLRAAKFIRNYNSVSAPGIQPGLQTLQPKDTVNDGWVVDVLPEKPDRFPGLKDSA